MNPNSSELDKDHGKKRKIDSDGFACPNTPETPRMPFFMHTAYTNDADIEVAIPSFGKDDEAVTSEYFQHSEGTECNKENMSSDTSEAAAAIGNTADYNYDESGPGDTTAQYQQEKVDNYHYVSHSEGPFEPKYSQDNVSNGEKPTESDKQAPSFGYESSDVGQGQPDSGYYQPQTEAAGQPNASGAATANTGYDVHRYVDEALKLWKQERDEIHEYWSGVFRLSQDYEEKALEKIELLNEKAKALDETMLQQKEAVMQRVQGIGKILELQ